MSQSPVGGPQGRPWVRVDHVQEYAKGLVDQSETLRRLPSERALVQSYIQGKIRAATRNAVRDVHDHGYPQGRPPHAGVQKLRNHLARFQSPVAGPALAPPETAELAGDALAEQPWARNIPLEQRPGLDAYVRSEAAAAGNHARKVAEAWADPVNHEQIQGVAELDGLQERLQAQQAQRMLAGTHQQGHTQVPTQAAQVAQQGQGWVPQRTQQQEY